VINISGLKKSAEEKYYMHLSNQDLIEK